VDTLSDVGELEFLRHGLTRWTAAQKARGSNNVSSLP